jgi:competence protein CoiA
MPLLALVDGLRTVSTLLSDDEWQSLKVDVHAGWRSVVLPYCGLPGYLRTSKLGVRHFAHKSAGDCSSHPGETGQHLRAKGIAVEGARAAGWQAEPEVRGDGWIADVFAVGGARKVALEIQWSAQRPDEFERRQARYAADGIRCAWFTRHERSVLPPQHDLPVFHLAVTDDNVTTTIGDINMPLADAVTALLSGRISYRDHVSTGQPATIRVMCFKHPCNRCSAVSMVWEVECETITGPCGTIAEHQQEGTIWGDERPETDTDIRHRAFAEARILGLPPATLGSRYSKTYGGSYVAFGCPRCRTLIGDWFLRTFMLEERNLDNFTVVTLPGSRRSIEAPHWCIDRGQGKCVRV